MIRVVLLIPTLDRSGAEKQLTLLACGLPRDEFRVQVVTLTRGGPYAELLKQHGVPLTVLHKRFKFDPWALLRLKRLFRELKPDVLHTWLFTANAYGRFAAGATPRFPIIVSERCVDTWKSGWQLWCDRRLAPRTARLVGNSQSVADFYRERGFPPDRLRVIQNGIELPPVSSPQQRHLIRQELGLSDQACVIGYVGRLARQKRVDDLIWGTELVRHLHDDVHLALIGDGPERDRLQQFARTTGIEHLVHFLGHRDDAERYWPAFDVFGLASDFEGQSNSLMEAQAHGIPVVASDIPPNRELVSQGESGYLVPVGDRAAFAQCFERLLVDRDLGQRFTAAARERLQREFNLPRMITAYAELYREVVTTFAQRDRSSG